MKKILIGLSLFASFVFTSCDEWLDFAPKGQIVLTTAEEYAQLFDNISTIQYGLSDIEYLNDEVWVNTLVIANGWNSMNMVVANVLYKTDYDRSVNGSSFFQEMYGRITKIANTIIYNAGQGEIKGTPEEIAQLVAQAKAYRAFAYFGLINYYARPYNAETAATDGGVPIRTDAQIDALPNPAKSSVADVYALMEKDMNEAIPDLPEEAKTVFRFNKAAGYALKAKIHLFKKEYDACIAAAEESYKLNHYTYDLVNRIDTVRHYPEPTIDASGEENLMFATTSTTYFLLHPELIALFRQGLTEYGQEENVRDVRLGLYQQPNPAVKDYQYTLQYMPTALQYATNSIGFRTTEVMLMLGECYARKGENGKVKEYMEPYLKSRYANYDPDKLRIPDDVTEAVKFVLAERRKELTMGYNRFFDLKRLNTELEYVTEPTRTIPLDTEALPGIPQDTYTLPYNSSLYVVPFSEDVLLNDERLESNHMND